MYYLIFNDPTSAGLQRVFSFDKYTDAYQYAIGLDLTRYVIAKKVS